MNLADVMDELGTALDAIPGLRVFPYWADRITPPAAVVGWPEQINYHATYKRGGDRAEIPVTVLAGKVDARSARDILARYADGSGTHSVVAAIDSYDATAYHSATVLRAGDFTAVSVAGVEYLACTFDIDIMGKGAP